VARALPLGWLCPAGRLALTPGISARRLISLNKPLVAGVSYQQVPAQGAALLGGLRIVNVLVEEGSMSRDTKHRRSREKQDELPRDDQREGASRDTDTGGGGNPPGGHDIPPPRGGDLTGDGEGGWDSRS
jgi:hypothetical protein